MLRGRCRLGAERYWRRDVEGSDGVGVRASEVYRDMVVWLRRGVGGCWGMRLLCNCAIRRTIGP